MKVTRWPTIGVNQLLKRWPRRVGSAEDNALDGALERYSDYDVAFAHVGLSDVNAALVGNPYDRVLGALTQHFESVLAPGFTDYVHISGVYDKRHSRPKHGAFCRQFLDDAEYRTNDAIKSILVKGEYRFDACDHHDSYSEDGCFQQLYEDDVLVVSIGTPYLVCSYLHHLEARNGAPYMEPKTVAGIMYDENGNATPIEQQTHQYREIWSFNKPKLHRDLRASGFLDTYDYNGLRIFVTSIRSIDELVTHNMNDDPYYLVTL